MRAWEHARTSNPLTSCTARAHACAAADIEAAVSADAVLQILRTWDLGEDQYPGLQSALQRLTPAPLQEALREGERILAVPTGSTATSITESGNELMRPRAAASISADTRRMPAILSGKNMSSDKTPTHPITAKRKAQATPRALPPPPQSLPAQRPSLGRLQLMRRLLAQPQGSLPVLAPMA